MSAEALRNRQVVEGDAAVERIAEETGGGVTDDEVRRHADPLEQDAGPAPNLDRNQTRG